MEVGYVRDMLKVVDSQMKAEVEKGVQAAQQQIDSNMKAFDDCAADAPR